MPAELELELEPEPEPELALGSFLLSEDRNDRGAASAVARLAILDAA